MNDVATVMRGCSALLLDFDGPVAHLFAGHPAPIVAGELRRFLRRHDAEPPADLGRDALKTLQWVGTAHPALTPPVEDLLIAGERHAAASSEPTVGAFEVIAAAQRAGWPVAIVSNNSAAAIDVYLDRHAQAAHVTVVGRPYGHPEQMKPAPDLLYHAAGRIGVAPASCVLVGDSPTDMQAAIAAGARRIGYAKGPDRRAGLAAAGAEVVVDDMRELLGAWVAA